MVVARRALVSGRVHGVFYRATAAAKARELGITGSAWNLEDGRVEVIAYGAPDKVSAFFEWLWIGSTASKVTGVEESDIEASETPPERFTTR
jgi:acylphosphatase